MSYLKNNNNKIIVDAILTDYGKAKLAAQGTLDIYKFAAADDEIDYTLYNTNHPQGTDYYNSAIVNLPTLQALPGAGESMKYLLFTPSSSNTSIVEELVLDYDASITGSGIVDNRVFSVTPSITPPPGDITQIYYTALLRYSGASQGEVYKFSAVLNEDIGLTQDIINARNSLARVGGQIKAVAAGHSFRFQVTTPPRNTTATYYLYIYPKNVNARSQRISIVLRPRSSFQS